MKRVLSIMAVSGAVLLAVLAVVSILLDVGTAPVPRSLALGAGASKIIPRGRPYVPLMSSLVSFQLGATKFVPAGRAYAKLLKAEGAPIPAFVNVKELVARGLLGQGDLKGFAKMEVSVSTAPGDHLTNELVRARQSDGTELVLLADGSVHENR
jgi:hypothetical protein